MPIAKDLRGYIKQLKKLGEVQEIDKEVDWNLEVGAVMRRANDFKAPSPLFNSIKGYPKGFRIFGSPVNGSRQKGRFYVRIATSLGLRPDAKATEIIETLAKLKKPRLIPPRTVTNAPCKENILTGDKVDLFKFPVPYLHDGDGGRYIGTWHTVVTRTPDEKWTNWGMYRIMVHDRKSMGGLVVPTQHIGKHFSAWQKLGKDMPFAVAIGTDPVTPLVSAMGLPENTNEVDAIGGYLGKPVDVVQCETSDLRVPAVSEIVIEGTISTKVTRAEGPFGEYTGYLTAGRGERPVYNVSAITHRNDPILPCVCPGEPVEDHLGWSLILAAELLHDLRNTDIPVIMTYIPTYTACHILVVSVDKAAFKGSDRELVQQIGKVIWNSKAGVFIPKVFLINNDVDPVNFDKIIWAFSTRNHPGKGIITFPDTNVFPLFPFLSKEEKTAKKCTTVVFDCTWPSNWPKDYVPKNASFGSLWPKKTQRRVIRNWSKYGYEDFV